MVLVGIGGHPARVELCIVPAPHHAIKSDITYREGVDRMIMAERGRIFFRDIPVDESVGYETKFDISVRVGSENAMVSGIEFQPKDAGPTNHHDGTRSALLDQMRTDTSGSRDRPWRHHD